MLYKLLNKDNFILTYKKIGSQYQFKVFNPFTKKTSHLVLMSKIQFYNYLYAELYV